MSFDPLASVFCFKSLANTESARFKIRVYAHEFIDHEADYTKLLSQLMPLIQVAAGCLDLPPVQTRVRTVQGDEMISILYVPNLEIESWPLPPGCGGLN